MRLLFIAGLILFLVVGMIMSLPDTPTPTQTQQTTSSAIDNAIGSMTK